MMQFQHLTYLGSIAMVVTLSSAIAAFGQDSSSSTGTSGKTLRQAAGDRMLIGTALMSHHLDQPQLAKLAAEQFNCLTHENEMKPDQLQRNQGEFTFEKADKLVAFAQANNMKIIGHTLCWHQQSPSWMFADAGGQPLSREEALANLKQHIQTVMQHYKGKIHGYDVVNEAIGDSEPYLRDTPARKAIGDDFVVQAFKIAQEADPDVELYYNDYNIEAPYKREKGLKLIRELKNAGVRLDAVGIQGHWLIDTPLKEIEDGLKTYAAEGVKLMITELDVDPLPRGKGGGADVSATEREGLDPYKDQLPPDLQQKLARRYGELFKLFTKYKVTRVTFWGTNDGNSWLNNFPVRGRTNHPLLWDRQLRAKPALAAVMAGLQPR
jgi:endo-1,4-beta-xylanase